MKNLILSLIVLLAVSGLANAALSFSDTLTGYTGTTDDAATLTALAANGHEPMAPETGKRVVFDATGALFDPDSKGAGDRDGVGGGRNVLRTIDASYNTVSFEAYVTINSFAGSQTVYAGLGAGVTGGSRGWGLPDWKVTTSDGIFSEIKVATGASLFTQNDGVWTRTYATEAPGAGTHRVLLAHNAAAQTVTLSIDKDYDGTFVADFVIGTASTAGLWTGSELGSIYFGGGDDGTATGPLLTDFDVTVIPEPATMILLGLGGLGFLRRRK